MGQLQARKSKIIILACMAAGAVVLLLVHWGVPIERYTPPCAFQWVTGLHCAGCGVSRMVIALCQGQLYAAFAYNPLLFCSLGALGVVGLDYCLRQFTRFRILPPYEIPKAWTVGLVILVIGYTIVRNIPIAPFIYLSPGALLFK